jgi:hypothetical protein
LLPASVRDPIAPGATSTRTRTTGSFGAPADRGSDAPVTVALNSNHGFADADLDERQEVLARVPAQPYPLEATIFGVTRPVERDSRSS